MCSYSLSTRKHTSIDALYCIQEFACLPYCFNPFGSFVFRIDVKHPFNNGRPLKTADNECIRSWSINRHNLATSNSKVVRWFRRNRRVGSTFVADKWAVSAQDKVSRPPVFNVFASFVQPSFFNDLTWVHVDILSDQIG